MAEAISASAQRAAARRRRKAAGGDGAGGRAAGRRSTGRSGIRWDRVARAALLGTLVVVLLLYISPLHRWVTQRGVAAQETSQLHQLERQNHDLRSRIKQLHDPAALDAQARRLGMVRRGEREYVISGLPSR